MENDREQEAIKKDRFLEQASVGQLLGKVLTKPMNRGGMKGNVYHVLARAYFCSFKA
jgi:hypothetical protein